MYRIIIALILIPLVPSAAAEGFLREATSNEYMQLYVVSVKQEGAENGKLVRIEVIIKNISDAPRAFNPFFAKLIDSKGKEHNAAVLYSSIMPIRIPPDDILRGEVTFGIENDAEPDSLIWEEGEKISIKLIEKDPEREITQDERWIPSSSKGKVISDGRLEIRVNDEQWFKGNVAGYLIDLSLKNLSKEDLTYNAAFSFVKDEKGYLYFADLAQTLQLSKPLKKGILKPGEEVNGKLLFLLPPQTEKVLFIYDDELGGRSYIAVPEFPLSAIIAFAAVTSILLSLRIR